MSRPRAGTDSSSNEDEAPPTLFIQPTSTKRAARAPSPVKRANLRRSPSPRTPPSPRSPPRRPFAPNLLESARSAQSAELAIIPRPAEWSPPPPQPAAPAQSTHIEAMLSPSARRRPVSRESAPDMFPRMGASPTPDSRATRSQQPPSSSPPASPPKAAASPQRMAASRSAERAASPPAPGPAALASAMRSPQKEQQQRSPRRLRFATPQASASPHSSALSSPSPLPTARATPSPASRSASERMARDGAHGGIAKSPKLTAVPALHPPAQFEAPVAGELFDASSSSPYGAQRSPQRPVALSPERPLTMQAHYLLAQEGADPAFGTSAQQETLGSEIAVFGRELDDARAPAAAALSDSRTLMAVEAPLLWRAIKDLHARGRALLAEVLAERQRRVSLDDLPGGYARFGVLHEQGVESAIAERQRRRCLTLRAQVSAVQQLFSALSNEASDLDRRRAEANALEAQIRTHATALAQAEAAEAAVEAEEAAVREAEARVAAAAAQSQAQRAETAALIAQNRADLDEVSAAVLHEWPSQRERAAAAARADAQQRLRELQHELGVSISLREGRGDCVYLTAEFLGVVVDVRTQQLAFALRHRGTPVYHHYLRLIEASSQPLRERLRTWQAALAAQRAINALARFGACTYAREPGVLVYKQRLYGPRGELVVRFEGAQQHVDGVVDGVPLASAPVPKIEDFDAGDDVKPVPHLALADVVERLQAAAWR